MPLKIEDFHIEFHQRWGVYHPGQTVTGNAFLALTEPFYCDQVEVFFYGVARVFWCGRDAQLRNSVYSNEKVFFSAKETLWTPHNGEYLPSASNDGLKSESQTQLDGSDKVQQRPMLSAGRHHFPLSFQLPEDLPSSFDARNSPGFIRYSAKVSLMQLRSIKTSRKAYFTIIRSRDLHSVVGAALPVWRESVTESVSPGCCASGQISIVSAIAQLDHKGFVSGEPIRLTVSLKNTGYVKLKSLRAALVQKIFCFASSPEPQMKEIVNELTAVVAPKSENSRWNSQKRGTHEVLTFQLLLYVPAVVPTFSEPQLIECEYFLVVDIRLKGQQLQLNLPIEIGSIPLMVPTAIDSALLGPPPTYEESVMGISAVGENDPASDYLPRYVSYPYNHQLRETIEDQLTD